jgi:hypothetical protein
MFSIEHLFNVFYVWFYVYMVYYVVSWLKVSRSSGLNIKRLANSSGVVLCRVTFQNRNHYLYLLPEDAMNADDFDPYRMISNERILCYATLDGVLYERFSKYSYYFTNTDDTITWNTFFDDKINGLHIDTYDSDNVLVINYDTVKDKTFNLTME